MHRLQVASVTGPRLPVSNINDIGRDVAAGGVNVAGISPHNIVASLVVVSGIIGAGGIRFQTTNTGGQPHNNV
jgi:hypothetical protein